MTLKKILSLIIFTFCLTDCFTATQKGSTITPKEQNNVKSPKVDIKIEMVDTVLNSSDKIILTIKLTNNENVTQQILFDNPQSSTGGPWGMTATVVNIETKESVLKYTNKAILSSNIYTESQLEDKYYNLLPEQTICGQYQLDDIVVFKSPNNSLQAGTYIIQLFYYKNPSNTLVLTIE